MQPFVLIGVAVLGLLVLGLLAAWVVARRASAFDDRSGDTKQHPRGYGVGMGISLGAGVGTALGVVFDNIALGIPIGVGLGIAVGAAWERAHASELRPLTASEKRLQKSGVLIGLVLALLGVLVFVTLWLLVAR